MQSHLPITYLGASLVLAFAGCATSSTGGLTGGGGGAGADGGVMSKHVACSPQMPCDPGKTCVSGICAAGCNGDADCEPTQYCALSSGQICLDITLDACPATPCAPTQVCVNGLCGTEPTGTPCGPGLFGGDGCMKDAICLDHVTVDGSFKSDGVCYNLPPCSPDHPCSPGGMGALCSHGFVMGKNDMCIPGACATDDNCPASWKCVPGPPMSTYGECTDGGKGHPCGKSADCKAGLQCYVPIQSELGTCK